MRRLVPFLAAAVCLALPGAAYAVVYGIAHNVPRLTVPAAVRVSRNAAKLQLRCAGATACKGRLRIQSRPLACAADVRTASARAVITYSRASFSIAAGGSRTITVRLGKAGMRALARRRSLTAYANASFSDGRIASPKITLKR